MKKRNDEILLEANDALKKRKSENEGFKRVERGPEKAEV
jgi:hypothetical protein